MKLALATCLLLGVAHAQPWRYTDDKGQVHWTNDPYQLPPKLRDKALARREAKREAAARKKKAQEPAPAAAGAPSQAAPVAAPRLDDSVFGRKKPKPVAQLAPVKPKVDWAARIRAAEAKVERARAVSEVTDKELTAARVSLATVVSGPAYARRNLAVTADTAAKADLAAATAELERLKEEAAKAGQ